MHRYGGGKYQGRRLAANMPKAPLKWFSFLLTWPSWTSLGMVWFPRCASVLRPVAVNFVRNNYFLIFYFYSLSEVVLKNYERLYFIPCTQAKLFLSRYLWNILRYIFARYCLAKRRLLRKYKPIVFSLLESTTSTSWTFFSYFLLQNSRWKTESRGWLALPREAL